MIKWLPVVEELKEKGLLTESNGAMIVDLEDAKMPPCLIIRTDGGTLYATRDITAALYRKKTYDFDKALYVTAIDQNLHFAQWFKVIEKMGYDWAENLVHVPFGLVSLEDGKLSTRKGKVVLMEELLDEAVKKTLGIIDEKNPDLPKKDEVAKEVGIGRRNIRRFIQRKNKRHRILVGQNVELRRRDGSLRSVYSCESVQRSQKSRILR